MAKKISIPEEQLSKYDLAVSKVEGMDRKGVTSPYTSMNGNMYTIMRKDGILGIRLGENERKAFMEKYYAVPFENYGAMMKEYVEVPNEVLMDTDTIVEYLQMSHEYAKPLRENRPGNRVIRRKRIIQMIRK